MNTSLKAVLLVCLAIVGNLSVWSMLLASSASNNSNGSSLLITPKDEVQSGWVTVSSSKRRNVRFLVGIFTNGAFGVDGYVFERNRFRNYFRMFGNARICSIHEFRNSKSAADNCQFIYTFVAGTQIKDVNSSSLLPTWRMLNNNTSEQYQDYIHEKELPDGELDLTILNIQENMNQGKSQTWFRYAAELMDDLDIDYVVKMDSDCLIILDRFFYFINQHLATHRPLLTYVGRLSDKAFWPTTKQYQSTDADRLIKRMKRQSIVQVYMAGELYILSKDLAKWVGAVDHTLQPWYEEIEDHDVGLRIFDHPDPIHAIRMVANNQFWIHPAKDEKTWTLFLNRESFRKRKCLAMPEPKDFVMGPMYKKKFGSHLVEIPENATVCNE